MGTCQNKEAHHEHEEFRLDSQKIKSPEALLSISSYTWKKDSYNLFDYEAKDLNKQRFKTSFSGHFFRSGHNISFNNDIDSEQSLFSLKFCNKDIKLEPNDYNYDSDASCWIIAKNQTNLLKGIQYQLSIGDFIKLGRMYFKLKEVVINEEIKSPIILKEQRLDKIIFSPCKICLSDSFEDDDPLISLCRCIGSLKYIHLRCLKEWLNSKVSLKCMESYSLITWEKLECELCKTALSYQVNLNGKTHDIIDYEKPAKYIILETFCKKSILNGFYILDLSKKSSFKMGRAVDNEIRINDISVSRSHAALTVINNEVYFNDFDSKFGSLILLRKPMNLKLSTGLLPLQIGRTVFKIHTSWGSQAAEAFCCKSNEGNKLFNPSNSEKIDEFEISEEGLEQLSFEEMLMFSGNQVTY